VSADESIPSPDEFDSEAELDEYMEDVYRGLRNYWSDRRFHDRDGFFCEEAGGRECEALGHQPDPEVGWDDDDEHPRGWGGEIICPATRYGTACTSCEGDCDLEFFDPSALWNAVSA
jgi:hypothetical protein